MSLIEILRSVLTNIVANKFRVFLTALGIIVGALTIVLVVGIGKGSEASVKEQFAKLNAGTLYVMSAPGSTSTDALTINDLDAILERAPSVETATISVNGRLQVSSLNTSYSSSIVGVSDNYMSVNNLGLQQGRFIAAEDDLERRRIVVLGADLAEILFPGEGSEILEKNITISGRKYEVVGVLKRLGDSIQNVNIDEAVILPYQIAVKYALGNGVNPRITAISKDIKSVPLAIIEINDILKEMHTKSAGELFQVKDAGSKLVAAADTAKTMSILLVSIAIIVLIVGGIGIMNVLFVSIKERTREIGILKAIGSKRRDILMQFLLESMIISAAGGMIGILLGIFILPLMTYLDMRVIPSLFGNMLAFIFSIATGTFFGYYPATKAASLRPIDALSYE